MQHLEFGEGTVHYRADDGIARVTMSRPEYKNAQNSVMTYALDDAFQQAVDDDEVKVVILNGAGGTFSAGHDIGSPGRDHHIEYPRRAALTWSHIGREGAEHRMGREDEVYLGMCRRWREIPKPIIAEVEGYCIAGGLMLAWVCDFIVASDNAVFGDPVVQMGVPGVEYFAHPWAMGVRRAKEFLYTGRRISADEALEWGMVNKVVPVAELSTSVEETAASIAAKPPFGLALTKRALNACEDAMGMRSGMDTAYALHHVGHAHNAEMGLGPLGGQGVDTMRKKQKSADGTPARRASEHT